MTPRPGVLPPVLTPPYRKETNVLEWVWFNNLTRIVIGLEYPERGDFERAGFVQPEEQRTEGSGMIRCCFLQLPGGRVWMHTSPRCAMLK